MTEEQRQKKRAAKKRYYAKTAKLYPGRRWAQWEIDMVMEHSVPDSELSVKLQSSLKSIQEKRRREKDKTK